MRATELRYTRHERTTMFEAEPTTTIASLRLVSTADALVLDEGPTIWLIDFARARVTHIDRDTATCRESSLFARVHDRVSGLASALHAQAIASAAGLKFGAPWQAVAEYSASIEQAGEPPAIEQTTIDDALVWKLAGVEVTRARPSSASLPEQEARRLWANVLPVHPSVLDALVRDAPVPEQLHCRSHFKLHDREQTLTLESVAEIDFDREALLADLEPAPPEDDIHALALRRFDDRTPAYRHLDAARRLFAEGRDVEAALATFAQTLVSADAAGCPELLRQISDRSRRWSAARKLVTTVMSAGPTMGDEKATHARIATFDKLRRKAGDYAYILDVFAGEALYELHDGPGAHARLAAALRCDPLLSAAWVSMGRVYALGLKFNVTWDCWDQALAQCPHHNVMSDVHEWRRMLTTEHPQFF